MDLGRLDPEEEVGMAIRNQRNVVASAARTADGNQELSTHLGDHRDHALFHL